MHEPFWIGCFKANDLCSADLTAQADAIHFVKVVNAE
jgi:hypothetical protein